MNETVQQPKPAATILLLRDGAKGIEVFMVVRHHQIDFASGALVFPGGKVDPQDQDQGLVSYCEGCAGDPVMRGLEIAALREAFEECGVLLARASGESALIEGKRLQRLDAERSRINAGDLPLLEFLKREQLRLACDTLVHFAHWITPPMMPKRFDTHFFIARAPGDQLLLHDGYESVDSVWIRPTDALAEAEAGERTVIFPTLRNLEKLAEYKHVGEALARTPENPIVPVTPWTEKREDGTYLLIPEDAGYRTCEQKLPPGFGR